MPYVIVRHQRVIVGVSAVPSSDEVLCIMKKTQNGFSFIYTLTTGDRETSDERAENSKDPDSRTRYVTQHTVSIRTTIWHVSASNHLRPEPRNISHQNPHDSVWSRLANKMKPTKRADA